MYYAMTSPTLIDSVTSLLKSIASLETHATKVNDVVAMLHSQQDVVAVCHNTHVMCACDLTKGTS